MTSLPPNADELVSAYLDGEAAPDEIAVVEANTELMARVESLRGVADLVGAPISAPAAQREVHLAAALDLFDELHTASGTGVASTSTGPAATAPRAEPGTTHTVTSLAQARERRRPRRAGLLAAAAAALLLFVGVTALNVGRGGNDSAEVADEATSATAADTAAADAAPADDGDTAAASADLEPAGEDAARALDQAESAPAEPETMAVEAADEAEAADAGALDDSAGATADDAAMDDQEAAEQEADDDTAFAEEAEAPRVDAYYLGDFVLDRDLADELGRLSLADLDDRLRLGEGLFPSCQQQITELARVPTSTLVARARIDDRAVEVHQLRVAADVATLLVVDERTCEVTAEVAAPG